MAYNCPNQHQPKPKAASYEFGIRRTDRAVRDVAGIDLEIDPIPAIPATTMKIQLDQDQLHAASSAARANVSTLLRELGKNAYDAGARVVDVAMDRDSTGRLVSIRCRHDGAALSSEALESFLRAGIRHEVAVDRTKLGEFGPGIALPGLLLRPA